MNQLRASREIIRRHTSLAMAAAVTPLPGVDIAAVSAVQIALVRSLARHHEVAWDALRGRAVVLSVAGASLARVGASVFKGLPGAGWVFGGAAQAALSGASTWALGTAFRDHFLRSGTLEDVDAASLRARYRASLARGRAVARAIRSLSAAPELDEEAARRARLAGLRRTGALTQDEFDRLVAPGGDDRTSTA